MAPPTLEDGRLALHEPFDEDDMQRQTLGLLVFLPAAAATVVLAVFWVNRILYPPPRMLMPPASRAVDRLPSPNPLPRSVVARPYSLYDLIAGCGTTFLINLCITVVVPAALSSAENRGHDSPLTASGSVAAASALGMVISVIVMYPWPTELVEGKLPALVFAAFLLIGNVAFLGVEWVGAELHYLLACRVLMSLGFGAGYAAKQRAGSEPDPRRREYLFMLLELASSLGMASGPILTGGLTLVWPHNSALLPPTLMIFLAIAFALVLLTCPLRWPFSYSLPDRAAKSAAVTGGGGDGSDSVQLQAASKEGGMRPVESTPLVSGGGAGGGGRGPGGGVATWVAATVQVTCLLLGVTRCFLKYGFESAMVVVYDRQLMMSEGAAGVVAGACGLSAVVSTLVYRGVCAGRYRSSTLLLVAEVLGIASALLLISTALLGYAGVPIAHAATLTSSHPDAPPQLMMVLTLLASLLFYPSMYLSAALGNSHPLQFARPGHPLLSLSSMVAQQELLQTTLGKGLGMMLCRVALGDPARVSSLGEVFAVIMLVQSAVLAVGWDPRTTIGRCVEWRAADESSA